MAPIIYRRVLLVQVLILQCAARSELSPSRARPCGIRYQSSHGRELCLRVAMGTIATLGTVVGHAREPAAGRLADSDIHVLQSGLALTPILVGSSVLNVG